MDTKFFCVYSEMQALESAFEKSSSSLRKTAVEMQAFHDKIVITTFADFKAQLVAFDNMIAQIKMNSISEIACICGNECSDEADLNGTKADGFVKLFYDSDEGLFNSFHTLHQNIAEINDEFTNLEAKITNVVATLNIDSNILNEFCLSNRDFCRSKYHNFSPDAFTGCGLGSSDIILG